MSEFILGVEAFKLGFTEKVPMPKENECFLLYQAGGGERKSFVVQSGIKYSATAVRHGRYNQKAIISLTGRQINQNYRVAMMDNDFYFNVGVKISYSLNNVTEYFFGCQIDRDDAARTLRTIMRENDGKWNIQQRWEIQSHLENEIERRLKKYTGVRFVIQELTVTLDESAEKMLESNRKKTVGIHVTTNETDEQIAKNEQNLRIADSERQLKIKKIEELAEMINMFGNMAPIVEDYLKGGMSGEQLYNFIIQAKNDNMAMLNTAISNDLLTEKEIIEKLNEIIGNNGMLKKESQQLSGNNQEKIEEKSEAEKAVAEEEAFPEDGDYI